MFTSSDSHSNRSSCEALPFLILSGSEILFHISHKDISEHTTVLLTEDKDSGPQGNAEVQEPGEKSGQVWPCLYFVSRMPLEKSKIGREGNLLNPYIHPSHTVPNKMRLPRDVTKTDKKRTDGILFPHIINKAACKAIEDATKAGKTHAQTWGGGKQKKKGRECGGQEKQTLQRLKKNFP